MKVDLTDLYNAILDGDQELSRDSVLSAIDAQIDPQEILNTAMIPAMGEVGRRFEDGEYYVPEMLISARAMQESLKILKPLLVDANIKATGRVVIGTVKGDLHDIGKNLVAMMLEGAGFEVIDLGTDVSAERFIDTAWTRNADIVAMSALLTTTMPGMRATIEALQSAGLRSQVKIMVGGAPVTEEYAMQIGADGYAADASRAVTKAKSLLGL